MDNKLSLFPRAAGCWGAEGGKLISFFGIYPKFEYAHFLPKIQRKHGPAYGALAKLLREARQDAQLTQTEAARKLGKHQSFISKCESGERRLDLVELKALAELYGKDLLYFNKI